MPLICALKDDAQRIIPSKDEPVLERFHIKPDLWPDGLERSIALTRNPWEWTVSLWQQLGQWGKVSGVINYYDSFDLFVRNLHIWPKDWRTKDTIVFPLEDYSTFCDYIDSVFDVTIERKHKHKTKDRKSVLDMFTSQDLIDYVEQANVEDIERFNYAYG